MRERADLGESVHARASMANQKAPTALAKP